MLRRGVESCCLIRQPLAVSPTSSSRILPTYSYATHTIALLVNIRSNCIA